MDLGGPENHKNLHETKDLSKKVIPFPIKNHSNRSKTVSKTSFCESDSNSNFSQNLENPEENLTF